MFNYTRHGLIRPAFVQTIEEINEPTFAVFVLNPLERGFGNTIGVALRRVLMHSLPGSALSSVRFDKPIESMWDVVLNLKEVRLSLESDEVEFQIQCNRAGTVFVSDLPKIEGVRFHNPQQPIATLAAGETLSIAVRARKGRGYVSAGEPKSGDQWIALDRLYSPVLSVDAKVIQARVGERTDYDQLRLSIRTDGAVTPRDALTQASRLLLSQLSTFTGLDDYVDMVSTKMNVDEQVIQTVESKRNLERSLNRRIDEFELSVRSANCLENLGVTYVWELAKKTEKEVLNTRNMGVKSLRELSELLTGMGLGFGMSLGDFAPEMKAENGDEFAELDDANERQTTLHHACIDLEA